ncbi:MAG: PAS domain-containing protein [Alphaproteobacteria bacterium]
MNNYAGPNESSSDYDALRSFLNDSPVPLVIKRALDGAILYVNPVLLDVFRISEEALLKRGPHSLYVSLQARDSVAQILEAEGRVREFPVQMRRADNTVFNTRMWAARTRFENEDAVQYWMTDITELSTGVPSADEREVARRELAEAQLRTHESMFQSVFANIPISMTMKGRDGRYVHVNPQFAKWIGRGIDEIVGQTASALFDDATARNIAAADALVFESGVAQSREFDVTRHDGEVRHLLWVRFPIRAFDGSVDTVGVAMIDLTVQRQLENELHQSQKMEAIGQLTGGVAHDFNNMLSVVLGNLELIEELLDPDDKLHPLIEAAIRGAERGASLNQQLLSFSRRAFLAPKAINMNGQVLGLVEMLQRVLGETIEIQARPAENPWLCIADPAQVEAALLNLAVNARDAMPDGGRLMIETANVTLDDKYATAQAEVTPGQYVMLAVSDTGTGMTPEVRKRVFEPFFTTKGVNRGTGLGLSMVFGFAKQSGGHATIYSEIGRGTTVKLYLPRTVEPETAPYEPAEAIPRAKGETVLVVEDDAAVRSIAVTLLANLGYGVLEACDGGTAIAVSADAPRIDLLLTDVVLPGGMNGPRVSAAVRRFHPGIRTLYMSGYAESAIIHHGRLDDGVVVLQKPFRKAELAQRAREALEHET